MEEKSIKKKMENLRLRFALESVVAMWRIKDKPTSTDCYESFKQISKRENVFCVTRRQYGNYLNMLEENGLIKTKISHGGRKGVKMVISVPKVDRDVSERDVLAIDLFGTGVLPKEAQKTHELAENLFDAFEVQEKDPGAISMSIWEFERYLEQYKDLKRGFDLDGVLNTLNWYSEVSHQANFDFDTKQRVLYSLARSTEFVKMLRPSDCVISTRPARWFIETEKWLVDHEVLAKNLYLRPKNYKSIENDCIMFKSATIREQGIEIYLDGEKDVANGVKHVLPNLVTCYLDTTPSTTQIILRY